MAKHKRFRDLSTEEVKPEVKTVQEEVKEEPVVVEEKEELVEAEVDGVRSMLNIRMKPEVKDNNQIAMLGKGTRLFVVNPKEEHEGSGEKWYKVRLSKEADKNDPANNGYAMKKYIKLL